MYKIHLADYINACGTTGSWKRTQRSACIEPLSFHPPIWLRVVGQLSIPPMIPQMVPLALPPYHHLYPLEWFWHQYRSTRKGKDYQYQGHTTEVMAMLGILRLQDDESSPTQNHTWHLSTGSSALVRQLV